MEQKKWIKMIFACSLIFTLAACTSMRHAKSPCCNRYAVNRTNAAYAFNHHTNGPHASGLGEDGNFGEQSLGGKAFASHRVYYFDFDSNVVHDADKPAILANADYLLVHPKTKIILEGHTDPRGSREYNIGLGERRANSVAKMLTEKGVSPNQIRVVSYGAQKLVSKGHSEDEYQKDRRGVIVYSHENS